MWNEESMRKKDVEKMMEMINKVKETEKENNALLYRLEEVCFSISPFSYVLVRLLIQVSLLGRKYFSFLFLVGETERRT